MLHRHYYKFLIFLLLYFFIISAFITIITAQEETQEQEQQLLSAEILENTTALSSSIPIAINKANYYYHSSSNLHHHKLDIPGSNDTTSLFQSVYNPFDDSIFIANTTTNSIIVLFFPTSSSTSSSSSPQRTEVFVGSAQNFAPGLRDGRTTDQAQLNAPRGISPYFGPAGRGVDAIRGLFISDSGNNCVRFLNIKSTSALAENTLTYSSGFCRSMTDTNNNENDQEEQLIIKNGVQFGTPNQTRFPSSKLMMSSMVENNETQQDGPYSAAADGIGAFVTFNRDGHRILLSPRCLFWMNIFQENEDRVTLSSSHFAGGCFLSTKNNENDSNVTKTTFAPFSSANSNNNQSETLNPKGLNSLNHVLAAAFAADGNSLFVSDMMVNNNNNHNRLSSSLKKIYPANRVTSSSIIVTIPIRDENGFLERHRKSVSENHDAYYKLTSMIVGLDILQDYTQIPLMIVTTQTFVEESTVPSTTTTSTTTSSTTSTTSSTTSSTTTSSTTTSTSTTTTVLTSTSTTLVNQSTTATGVSSTSTEVPSQTTATNNNDGSTTTTITTSDAPPNTTVETPPLTSSTTSTPSNLITPFILSFGISTDFGKEIKVNRENGEIDPESFIDFSPVDFSVPKEPVYNSNNEDPSQAATTTSSPSSSNSNSSSASSTEVPTSTTVNATSSTASTTNTNTNTADISSPSTTQTVAMSVNFNPNGILTAFRFKTYFCPFPCSEMLSLAFSKEKERLLALLMSSSNPQLDNATYNRLLEQTTNRSGFSAYNWFKIEKLNVSTFSHSQSRTVPTISFSESYNLSSSRDLTVSSSRNTLSESSTWDLTPSFTIVYPPPHPELPLVRASSIISGITFIFNSLAVPILVSLASSSSYFHNPFLDVLKIVWPISLLLTRQRIVANDLVLKETLFHYQIDRDKQLSWQESVKRSVEERKKIETNLERLKQGNNDLLYREYAEQNPMPELFDSQNLKITPVFAQHPLGFEYFVDPEKSLYQWSAFILGSIIGNISFAFGFLLLGVAIISIWKTYLVKPSSIHNSTIENNNDEDVPLANRSNGLNKNQMLKKLIKNHVVFDQEYFLGHCDDTKVSFPVSARDFFARSGCIQLFVSLFLGWFYPSVISTCLNLIFRDSLEVYGGVFATGIAIAVVIFLIGIIGLFSGFFSAQKYSLPSFGMIFESGEGKNNKGGNGDLSNFTYFKERRFGNQDENDDDQEEEEDLKRQLEEETDHEMDSLDEIEVVNNRVSSNSSRSVFSPYATKSNKKQNDTDDEDFKEKKKNKKNKKKKVTFSPSSAAKKRKKKTNNNNSSNKGGTFLERWFSPRGDFKLRSDTSTILRSKMDTFKSSFFVESQERNKDKIKNLKLLYDENEFFTGFFSKDFSGNETLFFAKLRKEQERQQQQDGGENDDELEVSLLRSPASPFDPITNNNENYFVPTKSSKFSIEILPARQQNFLEQRFEYFLRVQAAFLSVLPFRQGYFFGSTSSSSLSSAAPRGGDDDDDDLEVSSSSKENFRTSASFVFGFDFFVQLIVFPVVIPLVSNLLNNSNAVEEHEKNTLEAILVMATIGLSTLFSIILFPYYNRAISILFFICGILQIVAAYFSLEIANSETLVSDPSSFVNVESVANDSAGVVLLVSDILILLFVIFEFTIKFCVPYYHHSNKAAIEKMRKRKEKREKRKLKKAKLLEKKKSSSSGASPIAISPAQQHPSSFSDDDDDRSPSSVAMKSLIKINPNFDREAASPVLQRLIQQNQRSRSKQYDDDVVGDVIDRYRDKKREWRSRSRSRSRSQQQQQRMLHSDDDENGDLFTNQNGNNRNHSRSFNDEHDGYFDHRNDDDYEEEEEEEEEDEFTFECDYPPEYLHLTNDQLEHFVPKHERYERARNFLKRYPLEKEERMRRGYYHNDGKNDDDNDNYNQRQQQSLSNRNNETGRSPSSFSYHRTQEDDEAINQIVPEKYQRNRQLARQRKLDKIQQLHPHHQQVPHSPKYPHILRNASDRIREEENEEKDEHDQDPQYQRYRLL